MWTLCGHINYGTTQLQRVKEMYNAALCVAPSVCIYPGEDMQDGVNVPALGRSIPDRDTHTLQLRVSQKHTQKSICMFSLLAHAHKRRSASSDVQLEQKRLLSGNEPYREIIGVETDTDGDMEPHKDTFFYSSNTSTATWHFTHVIFFFYI